MFCKEGHIRSPLLWTDVQLLQLWAVGLGELNKGVLVPLPHWQARKVLNSGSSGEDDVEVGLSRGPELQGYASRVEIMFS